LNGKGIPPHHEFFHKENPLHNQSNALSIPSETLATESSIILVSKDTEVHPSWIRFCNIVLTFRSSFTPPKEFIRLFTQLKEFKFETSSIGLSNVFV